ncbi:MAG: agmatinase family protein, partial [Cyclobacteriaceae bacterium]|nr:agmatinase family protein [Cyclobacteriaceae bacterium]
VIPQTINEISEKLNIYVKSEAKKYLEKGKQVGVVGGDHSTSLGLIRALSEKYTNFGILQIDAHADLRKAYEDFKYSHASIMYNALKCKSLTKLVQVGVRDCCEQEVDIINNSKGRITTFFDEEIKEASFYGTTWKKMCETIVSQLPEYVYISFDIDGLDPKYCPNTGTPVPGGLSYNEAIFLIKVVVASGKKIIGFDLNEVAPGNDEWDGNVGARLLYQLCNWMGISQGKLKLG